MLLRITFLLFMCVIVNCSKTYNADADTAASCEPSDFTCTNGRCVNIAWKCDGDDDCRDRSDEMDCPSTTCTQNDFQCKDGKCIPDRWVCDGISECLDDSDENPELCNNQTCIGYKCNDSHMCISDDWKCDGQSDCPNEDDEQNCSSLCNPTSEFKCNDSKCIDITWRCNDLDDCDDGSDERDCPKTECLADGEKMCSNGECISDIWWCDGYADCSDKSDEANCSSSQPAETCGPKEFQCNLPVLDVKCIHIAYKCDGDEDCSDGSDEFNCTHTCSADEKMCGKNNCIKATYFCDGENDCDDGEDEKNCSHTNDCEAGEFDCGNNQCISDELICNGAIDCSNGADEALDRHCPKLTNTSSGNDTCAKNNGGCNQMCIPDTSEESGRRCECNVGFELKGHSDTECDDIDECKIPGTCSQECKNTKGSYKCECKKGYTLIDHRYCKTDHGTHAELILSDRYDIRRYHLDKSHYSVLLPQAAAGAVAMDFDIRNQNVFWTNVQAGKIYSAHLRTNETKVIIGDNISMPEGLAVDWVHGNLYLSDTGLGKIEVARLDGSYRKTLINENLDEPKALVLDPSSGWMYWTDLGSQPKIEKCGMNGQNRRAIVTTGITWPYGLTIDYMQERLYWVDAKLHSIGSSDLDGNNFKLILRNHRNLGHPFAITLFEDYLYWTDWLSNAVHRFSKFGRDNVSTIALDLKMPMDIHVYHISRQPETPSSCGDNNGGCSHLCLPVPQMKTSTTPQMKTSSTIFQKSECACPDHMVLSDKFNCIESSVTTAITKPPLQATDSTRADDSHNSRSNSLNTQTVTTTRVEVQTSVKSEETTAQSVSEETRTGQEHSVTSNIVQTQHTEESAGYIAAIVMGSLLSVGFAIFVVTCLLLKRHKSRNVKSMNFDNPVYRKTTTEEQLIMEKNGSRSNLPQSMQPLNQDNEIV